MTKSITFEQAMARFPHRFTCEHVPAWARQPAPNGRYYAPQYASDREWYEKTEFHGEGEMADKKHCFSSGQPWPCGQWLDAPYQVRA